MTDQPDRAKALEMAREALADDAKATPGPWSATPKDEINDVCLFVGSGDWLANVGNWARGQDAFSTRQPETIEIEHAANAQWIAAARTREPILARALLASEASKQSAEGGKETG